MAEVAKVGVPSLSTPLPPDSCRIGPYQLGEDVGGGDACYIKSDGTIWRSDGTTADTILAPAAPAVATASSGGTILAAGYQVAVSYITPSGETTPSLATPIITTGTTSTITVTSPSASSPATAYRVYISQPDGTVLYLQNGAGTAIGTPFVLTAPPSTAGANPQTTNSSGGLASMSVDGFASMPGKVSQRQPMTLYVDVNFNYGASLTPGQNLYLSGTVKGGLATVPVNSTKVIARVQDPTRIRVKSAW